MMQMNKKIVIFGLALVILFSGCVAPEKEDFKNYCSSEQGFSFSYPENWAKMSNTSFGVVFYSPENSQKQLSLLTVSKSKEFEGVEYNSLNELIRAVLTPFEKDSSYKKLNDSPTTVGTTSARDITISYSEEGMQVRIRLIITEKRNGYFYKVALFSPKELFENDNKTFDEIVKSFRFEC